ncbi:type I-F CRISPR-associated endoribonuclease Cas6/Csy4 [Gynuella sunshinyii]|uniref:CRISPR-associated protein, Csy4 family n=1 Tax=Gynuella sunshinyii YC6258 TaxID=1445510 RepID=A0A0C5W2Z0_9GAMM|nr:type I-F CRISPR-associated endoribonuclease Cas6/Csy4 [Gynuella sunshinyii]AJQ97034.1 hypothetical Protein YC6258_05002 [Gynuella sunshinyii YC6258]
MDYYFDIRVLPDPEFKETILMNAVYAKLHRIIMKAGQGRTGLSFPEFAKSLGAVMRVHGSAGDLDNLLTENWLQGLRDYTEVTATLPVPSGCKHRVVRRRQAKSAHNKRKRLITKGWKTVEDAWQKYPEESSTLLKLPYAQFQSMSSKSMMRVFVEHGPLIEQPVNGVFSSYGLSQTATIPWFTDS